MFTEETAWQLQNSGINSVWVQVGEEKVKVVGNGFVDARMLFGF